MVEALREFPSWVKKICSCFHWSSLTIFIVAHQRDGALVPVPLMPGCGVRDVDRREEVQVSAKFFCPSLGLLRMSVLFILLPPICDGAFTTFPCSSSDIYCFPKVLVDRVSGTLSQFLSSLGQRSVAQQDRPLPSFVLCPQRLSSCEPSASSSLLWNACSLAYRKSHHCLFTDWSISLS